MASSAQEKIFEFVKSNALSHLSLRQQETTNLHLDRRLRQKGESLGPKFQNIVLDQSSILVFADHQPLANFGHDCSYLLFDPETGNLHREIPARFPPYLTKPPETLVAFHRPTNIMPEPYPAKIWPPVHCPIIIPDGTRYAILYSGMSNTRHLNDLEFCYRMLIDRYAFSPSNIYVLNYDGTMKTQEGTPALPWPGDNTPYRIHITGQGNRAGFQAVFNTLKTKLKQDDLLFIHTNNHGDGPPSYGPISFFCEYPSWGQYMANDFCTDLSILPHYKSLIVMMEQCNAGGFNAPVLAASTATNSSIASAAIATQPSWASPDGRWDSFARDWIAAQFHHNPNGSALASNPDTNADGVIEAVEAFNYAFSVKNPSDSPNFSKSSVAGGNVTLGQQYIIVWWWWCWIWTTVLEKYYQPVPPNPPDPEFYVKLQEILPELQKLVLPTLTRAATDVGGKVTPQIEEAVAKLFQRKRTSPT